MQCLNLANEVYSRSDMAVDAPPSLCERLCCWCVLCDEEDNAITLADVVPRAAMDVARFGFALQDCIVVAGVQCVVGFSRRQLFIAFRGTNNGANVFTDMHMTRVVWLEMGSGAKIHAGFSSAWEKIKPVLLGHVLKYVLHCHAREIVITGHSLGCA